MASNNCLNSPTCTSMTAHLAGIGSPADALSFERFVTALVRFYQDPKREAIARLVDSLDDLSEHHHHWHTNTYQVFENLYSSIMRLARDGRDRRHCQERFLGKTLHVLPLRSRPCVLKSTAWLIAMRNLRLLPDVSRRRWDGTCGRA
jgi:hypothetical protein